MTADIGSDFSGWLQLFPLADCDAAGVEPAASGRGRMSLERSAVLRKSQSCHRNLGAHVYSESARGAELNIGFMYFITISLLRVHVFSLLVLYDPRGAAEMNLLIESCSESSACFKPKAGSPLLSSHITCCMFKTFPFPCTHSSPGPPLRACPFPTSSVYSPHRACFTLNKLFHK